MTTLPMTQSFSAVFTAALRGDPCEVVGLVTEPHWLPVGAWNRPIDGGDAALLALCAGETLDIGCGPGRMTRGLAERGHSVLGIDVVAEAVQQTRDRGAMAIQRDVFETVPAEGRWATALLADGNIGIGGDPHALLARVRSLLAPGGRVVVDLAPPGTGVQTRSVRLQTSSQQCRPFHWSIVGADSIGTVAIGAGLSVHGLYSHGNRWFAVLRKGW
jgi:SAM-dependent methyltransferase